jgi:hypothetical protein
MQEIDWSKAPEGTTHYCTATGMIDGRWEKHDGGVVSRWVIPGVWNTGYLVSTTNMNLRTARPVEEPVVEEIVLQPVADEPAPVMNVEGYEKLADVLLRAYEQASAGKGKDRHANNLPFHLPPMPQICDQVGVGFAMGQAIKKAQESLGLPRERAIAEVLGAINYLAGVVIFMEKQPVVETASDRCVREFNSAVQAELDIGGR